MTVHFDYNKKEVIQALRYHFLTRPEIRILVIFVNVFAIASAVLFGLKKIQPFSFLIFSVLWLLLMLMIWRILPVSIYRRSRTFQESFSMSINDEDIVLNTNVGSQTWPWNIFSNFIESPHFFHLYFNSRSFFLLPKNAFEDALALSTARNIFKTKISR